MAHSVYTFHSIFMKCVWCIDHICVYYIYEYEVYELDTPGVIKAQTQTRTRKYERHGNMSMDSNAHISHNKLPLVL